MNINIFFVTLMIGLATIFFAFKPLKIKQRKFIDVPVFELGAFAIYELDTKGLSGVMTGEQGTKYSNRYTVLNINYTDSSKGYISNIKADNGLYKDDVLYLEGNVDYQRDDGVGFETKKAKYNKNTKTAIVDTKYTAHFGENVLTGDMLVYNTATRRSMSKNVKANYKLNGDKKQ